MGGKSCPVDPRAGSKRCGQRAFVIGKGQPREEKRGGSGRTGAPGQELTRVLTIRNPRPPGLLAATKPYLTLAEPKAGQGSGWPGPICWSYLRFPAPLHPTSTCTQWDLGVWNSPGAQVLAPSPDVHSCNEVPGQDQSREGDGENFMGQNPHRQGFWSPKAMVSG